MSTVAFAQVFVFQVEGGNVTKKNTYDDPTWDLVNLKFNYVQPIIIAIPNSNGDHPADFRIRNITSSSFELTLAEPPSEDGPHVEMDIAYVAMEGGQWSLPDGQQMAAGTLSTNQLIFKGGGSTQVVSLPTGFTNPIVLAQIQGLANETNNIPSQVSSPWMTVAVRNVTNNSFELALDGTECNSTALPFNETIGWMAIDGNVTSQFTDTDGLGILYETIHTTATIPGWDSGWATISYSQNYSSSPLFVAKMQTRNEDDGGWLRFLSPTSSSVSLRVDEDRCQDNERVHSGEEGGLFVFSDSFRIQDPDPDNDGWATSVDNCPFITNPGQENGDGDAHGDVCDNCVLVVNDSQSDVDMNGEGDACDCGDGLVVSTEGCDDGNDVAGDGCFGCAVESGWTCSGSPSVCVPICGDGMIIGGEQCDDGDSMSGDGCSSSCDVEPGWTCTGEPSVCVTTCGDSIIAGAEACDDGGISDGDGCSSSCEVELGWECIGQPSVCSAICGDGLIIDVEICDDGGTVDGDGCASTCVVEHGWYCMGEPSLCNTICGDGLIANVEECDDANADPGDGCSGVCEVELGWSCTGEASVCTPGCGDGIVAGSEECDDGNNDDGDGCSAICEDEPMGTGGGGMGGVGGGGGAAGAAGGAGGDGRGGASAEPDPLLIYGRGCSCNLPTGGNDSSWLLLLSPLLLLGRRRRRAC